MDNETTEAECWWSLVLASFLTVTFPTVMIIQPVSFSPILVTYPLIPLMWIWHGYVLHKLKEV